MKWSWLILLFLLAALSARADTDYVSVTGAGAHTGVDPNNAFPWPSINWVSSSTNKLIFLKGTYTGFPLQPAFGNYLIVPALGLGEETNAVGWNAATMAGPSTFIYGANGNNIPLIGVSGITIDGLTNNGFIFNNTTPSTYDNVVAGIAPSSGAHNIRILHCGFFGMNTNTTDSPAIGDRRGFNCSTLVSNIYIGYCEFAYFDTFFSSGNISNFVVDHNFFHENYAKPGGPHNNTKQAFGVTNCYIIYNVISNCFVENLMLAFTPTSKQNEDWYVYGNLLTANSTNDVGRFITTQYLTNNNNVRVFNNTVVGCSFFAAIENGGRFGSGWMFTNNLLLATPVSGTPGAPPDRVLTNYSAEDYYVTTTGHTAVGAHSQTNLLPSDLVVDYSGKNYRPKIGSPIVAAGADMRSFMLSPVDMEGNTFSATMEIGAFALSTTDTTAPTVTGVTSSTANGSYKAGDSVSIQVTFTESVTVAGGTPQLTLETGSTDRTINYVSGSPGTTLTFTYTVQSGDTSADLDYVATSSLSANGATIRDAAGNDATLTLPAPAASGSLGANKAIVIDTTAPAAPSTPDLASGSDTGISSTDNVTTDTTPTMTGTAESGSTVTLYSDGVSVGTGTASGGNWSITASTLTSGAHSMTATAADAAGNVSPVSSALSIAIDTRNPTVTINGPTSDATYTAVASTAIISGSASDLHLSTVTATNTTTGDAIALTGTTAWAGTASFQSGDNVIVVTGTDSVGNVGTDTLTVSYLAGSAIILIYPRP
jgi:hypothetical protein